jgi:hypothetical protein
MNTYDDNMEQEPIEPAKTVAFCQNCGKPLDQQGVRAVGTAVYCEPCLEARLTGKPLGSVPNVGPNGSTWTTTIPLNFSAGSAPNPNLAALLGLIPGVGAMYNEQYAKGIVHLIIFALLVSLSHSAEIFGLFVFGWVCYMAIEAHHTARARRDGTALPNPFGLNDIGERLGFGKAWPMAPRGPVTDPTAGTPGGYPPPPSPGYVPTSTAWGGPVDMGANPPAYGQTGQNAYGGSYGYGAAYGAGYVPPIPPIPPASPYSAPYTPVPPVGIAEPVFIPKANRFPAGAVWLIGLGTLFLLSTTGIFHTLFGWSLIGFVLIGLSVWIFLRRMMDTGATLGNDGTAAYSLRVVRALGPSVWVFAVGVLLLLNEYEIVPWHRSWPLFIILAGVMALLQRAASNAAANALYVPMQTASSEASSAASAGNPYSIVPPAVTPVNQSDSEKNVGSHEGDL